MPSFQAPLSRNLSALSGKGLRSTVARRPVKFIHRFLCSLQQSWEALASVQEFCIWETSSFEVSFLRNLLDSKGSRGGNALLKGKLPFYLKFSRHLWQERRKKGYFQDSVQLFFSFLFFWVGGRIGGKGREREMKCTCFFTLARRKKYSVGPVCTLSCKCYLRATIEQWTFLKGKLHRTLLKTLGYMKMWSCLILNCLSWSGQSM